MQVPGRAASVVALCVAGAGMLAPGGAWAAAGSSAEGTLSPRLAGLARPGIRSLPPMRQASLLGLPRRGPGSLLRSGGRVLANVRFEQGAAAGAEDLRAAGARVLAVSRRYQTDTVAVAPADLRRTAAVAGVAGVSEVLTPLLQGVECGGLVTSAGDQQLRTAEARRDFGLDGEGVTVGILSDSFDQATKGANGTQIATHAAEDVASGDLPGSGNPCGHGSPVSVLEGDAADPEKEEPLDEGRAMAQIVHDLAPGANLAFASAFNGELAFARSIERLAKPVSEGGGGAGVIADDVAYFEEPFFQDGPIAVAANRVAAAGSAYFTAAGNDNLIEEPKPGVKRDIASWEAPAFRDSGECPLSVIALSEEVEAEEVKLEEEEGVPYPGIGLNPHHCMNFNPGGGEADDTFGITVEAGATLVADLQWAEPWGGVETDLDAFLLDSAGTIVASSEIDNVHGSQQPFELIGWENETGGPEEVQLVINRYSGAEPRLKFALLQNGGGVAATEYPESSGGDIVGPTVFGHAGAAGAAALGAIHYDTSAEPEPYSSRGPVTHYFGPVSGAAPAPPLSQPQTIQKPDLTATDCGLTTFFVPTSLAGIYRFCGTSAASAHAAGVAALVRQANPTISPAQLRTALAASADPVGGFGPEAVGAGLIDAYGAVRSVALPPRITITEPPAPLSKNRLPSIAFTANRPVSFSCSIDGAAPRPCSSPFTPPAPLADGKHGFAVQGTDLAGRTGSSETVLFAVDGTPPRTFLRGRPRKVLRTRGHKALAVFRFGSNEKGVRFVCRVDGGLFRFCPARFARRFRVGRHVLRVEAVDLAGNVDRTPAVYRFRVQRGG